MIDPGTIIKSCGLGAASSSCSYAAVALVRSMFRTGENFTASMAFQFASTNLVLELGILLAVLMGWQLPPLAACLHPVHHPPQLIYLRGRPPA